MLLQNIPALLEHDHPPPQSIDRHPVREQTFTVRHAFKDHLPPDTDGKLFSLFF
jgi:hypothetical protein